MTLIQGDRRLLETILLGPGVLFCVVVIVAMTMPVSAAERPNVLLIVSEDNGPELGCYGDPYARTPNLDRLAGEGVRFDNAFVPYSVCSPSQIRCGRRSPSQLKLWWLDESVGD